MLSSRKSLKTEFKEELYKFTKRKSVKDLSTGVAQEVLVPRWGLSTAHSSMIGLASHETIQSSPPTSA